MRGLVIVGLQKMPSAGTTSKDHDHGVGSTAGVAWRQRWWVLHVTTVMMSIGRGGGGDCEAVVLRITAG